MVDMSLDKLLREQIEYYRARASEDDEWFLRRGRYDLGPERNAQRPTTTRLTSQAGCGRWVRTPTCGPRRGISSNRHGSPLTEVRGQGGADGNGR
jgi:hypothetical protein